jgi:ectoine hydroxylase-related dioxygenase (phytanoyl-CoA dioxygenase family)
MLEFIKNAFERRRDRRQKRFYDENGYLVLRKFFSTDEVVALKQMAIDLWTEPRDPNLIIDMGAGPYANQRMKLSDAPYECRKYNHKINDLYLISELFRSYFLSPKLVRVLSNCVEGSPLIINSLNFTVGSSQRAHFDTWYMPPPIEDAMVVASLALENCTPDNGPVFYYPGSHRLSKYRFSTGHIRAVESEMPVCDGFLWPTLQAAGIEKKVLICKAGDLFIWHSQLLHGGSPINDPQATRRSIVVHYWRQGDIEKTDEYPWLHNLTTKSHSGWYLKRPHQTPGKVKTTE